MLYFHVSSNDLEPGTNLLFGGLWQIVLDRALIYLPRD